MAVTKKWVAVLLLSLQVSLPAFAFTQSGAATTIGAGIPMGHEWITRLAAIEILGGETLPIQDKNDPRKSWKIGQGLANNPAIDGSACITAEAQRIKSDTIKDSTYGSEYEFVFDAILGERWVDLGGFDVTKGGISSTFGYYNCFDSAVQEPDSIQYDHFLRMSTDNGGAGGVNAATQSQNRFIQYFVAAAMAPNERILMWDGGAASTQYEVDLHYFLLGRAAHLLQDSFSSEHTVRAPNSTGSSGTVADLITIKEVKSYQCATGTEQHSHSTANILSYASGDVIWNEGTRLSTGSWSNYIPSNMKTNALLATEASKDLWAAFIRTMGQPQAGRAAWAKTEAQTIVNEWMSFNPTAMTQWYDNAANRDATYVASAPTDGSCGPQTQCACLQTIDKSYRQMSDMMTKLKTSQNVCLYNITAVPGYWDAVDPMIQMPFNWGWRNGVSWLQPPSGWTPPVHKANGGRQVYMINSASGHYVGSNVPFLAGMPLLNVTGFPTVYFTMTSPQSWDQNNGNKQVWFRIATLPTLFMGGGGADGSQVTITTGCSAANQYAATAASDNDQVLTTPSGSPIGVLNSNVIVVAPANAGENVHWKLVPASPATLPCAK